MSQPQTLRTAFLVGFPDMPYVFAHNDPFLLSWELLGDYPVYLVEKRVFLGLVGAADGGRIDLGPCTARIKLDSA